MIRVTCYFQPGLDVLYCLACRKHEYPLLLIEFAHWQKGEEFETTIFRLCKLCATELHACVTATLELRKEGS